MDDWTALLGRRVRPVGADSTAAQSSGPVLLRQILAHPLELVPADLASGVPLAKQPRGTIRSAAVLPDRPAACNAGVEEPVVTWHERAHDREMAADGATSTPRPRPRGAR